MKSRISQQANNTAPKKNLTIEHQDVEVDANGPDIGGGKNSKIAVMAASSVLITVVLYFIFFHGAPEKKEKLEEITKPTISTSKPATPEDLSDLVGEKKDDTVLLEKPAIPEIPKLPELPKADSGILPAFIDVPKDTSKTDQDKTLPTLPTTPTPIQPSSTEQAAVQNTAGPTVNPKTSPIIVVAGDAGPGNSVGYENNIINLNKDPIDSLAKTQISIIPTMVADRTKVISQGKMLTAVLETAINTEMPGNVRAIVSRDVYGESGTNVLIPKGSRLYGAYSSQITRGQGRVEISWTRLIRPDGVDMNISFNAADQFGRSGIEGDVDNKYGPIITNSLLTSILAVGGAIAAEKLSGGGNITTTVNSQQGSSTTVGKASSQAIYDVSKTIIDTVGQVIGNTIDVRPVIRVPQGTRITIIVNADMELPPVRTYNR